MATTGNRAIFQKDPSTNTGASWVDLWPMAKEDEKKLYERAGLEVSDQTHVIPYYLNPSLRYSPTACVGLWDSVSTPATLSLLFILLTLLLHQRS
jgi:hypothetical protein